MTKALARRRFTFTRNGSMRQSFAFTRNGSMLTGLLVSDPTTPTARAVAAEIERQHSVVERAVGIIGWPIRMPGTGKEG
jgi:hypothetical protein